MDSVRETFPYVEASPTAGPASALPYVPILLELGTRQVQASGLVDSGAALNVLPYDLGIELGAVWEHQTISVRLTGNLAASDARAIVLFARVGQFPRVRLAFAWTRNNRAPLILGQVNFFMEFDVSFYRSRLLFELTPANTRGH